MRIHEITSGTLFRFRGRLLIKTVNAIPHNAFDIKSSEVTHVPMGAEIEMANEVLTTVSKEWRQPEFHRCFYTDLGKNLNVKG